MESSCIGKAKGAGFQLLGLHQYSTRTRGIGQNQSKVGLFGNAEIPLAKFLGVDELAEAASSHDEPPRPAVQEAHS